jgi:hypothetical protein
MSEQQRPSEVPRRRIVKTTSRSRGGRYRLWAWLECGHLEPMSKKEAKQIAGSLCFDCYYNKPKHWDGVVNG